MIEIWGDSNHRDQRGNLVASVKPGDPVPSLGEVVIWCDFDHMTGQGLVCDKRKSLEPGVVLLSIFPFWSTWLWEDGPEEWTDQDGNKQNPRLSESAQLAFKNDFTYWELVAELYV